MPDRVGECDADSCAAVLVEKIRDAYEKNLIAS
jgi:hypothetical protein